MKQTINFYQFRDMFVTMDRESNFPDGGLSVLWDYLEQYEEDTGEELELDVIALCCDFSQESYEDIANNYSIDYDVSDCETAEERIEVIKEAVIDYLEYHSQIVGEVGDDQIIYQVF